MGLFSRDPDDDDADDGGNPLEGRGFVLSAIVVGAVVVCGIALVFLTRGGGSPQATPTDSPSSVATTVPTDGPTGGPATPDPSQPTPTGSSPTRSGTLACKRAPSDEGLSQAPAGVSWDFQDGILVPVRDTLGPSITDGDGIKRCFHRSPAGAVTAILNTVAQAQDPRHLTGVVQRRVMPGTGQRLAAAEARRILASPSPDVDRNTLGQVQYVGYKFIDYTQARAIVSVAIQVDPDHVGAITMAVRWSDGDWKMDLRSDGQLGPEPDVLASIDGFVRFRGS